MLWTTHHTVCKNYPFKSWFTALATYQLIKLSNRSILCSGIWGQSCIQVILLEAANHPPCHIRKTAFHCILPWSWDPGSPQRAVFAILYWENWCTLPNLSREKSVSSPQLPTFENHQMVPFFPPLLWGVFPGMCGHWLPQYNEQLDLEPCVSTWNIQIVLFKGSLIGLSRIPLHWNC